jgi:DNA-binding GntR family transcriptional regulator
MMSGLNISKIDQSKLRENVYTALHDAFTRGEFAPGDVVNLRSLAALLGTSMTPVREAVRRLVAEGALIDTPSRTLAVPAFDQERMLDLKRARLALETLVIDLAMEKMDQDTIDRLKTIVNTPSSEDSAQPDLVKNYEFHFTLYRLSGSQVLLPLIDALWLQYGAYLNLIIAHPHAKTIAEHKHHLEIIDALGRNDRVAARAALVEDIERSFNILQSG